jgi:carboxylesterase type B
MNSFVASLGLITAVLAAATPRGLPEPTARVINGTYIGVRNDQYNQDFFLGMPYAQQPVGDLRFAVPRPLNETWNGERDAKEYSDICVGYGVCNIVSIENHALKEDHTDRFYLVSHV